MKIGRQRTRLKLQTRATSVDSYGQQDDTWSESASRLVDVNPLNGREFLQASGENSDITVRLSVRYDATVGAAKPEDRWVDESVSPQVVFDIQAVINVGNRNKELVFMCKQQ